MDVDNTGSGIGLEWVGKKNNKLDVAFASAYLSMTRSVKLHVPLPCERCHLGVEIVHCSMVRWRESLSIFKSWTRLGHVRTFLRCHSSHFHVFNRVSVISPFFLSVCELES